MADFRLAHEYLVTCRGKPSMNRSSAEPVIRPDAVTRITKAAISQGCCIHLLFEDASLLSLGPGPLGASKWGMGRETSQGSLENLLRDAFAGMSIQGVQFKPGDRYASTRRARVHELLSENEGSRFARVVELHENGHPLPLLQNSSARATKSKSFGSADVSRQGVLFVIGGVRDVYSTERETIQEVCKELGSPYLAGLSVPGRAELTSKLIKFLEVLDTYGLLAKAVQQVCDEVESGRLRDTPNLNTPAGTEQPAPTNNTTTNVIVCLDENLADFVENPLATTLLVDLFMGSHTSHRGVTLSLFGSDGNALKLTHGGRCLLESDGFQILRSAHKNAFQTTLKSLLGSLVACAPRRSPTSSCQRSVLHVDSEAPALKMPQDSCMKIASGSGHKYMTVIFAHSCQKEVVSQAVRDSRACSDDGCYAYASAGDLMSGPAFLAMLGNEGWLAPAISASKGAIISRAAPPRSVKAASCAPRDEQRNHAGAQHHISLFADNLALAAQLEQECAKTIDARADTLSASDDETSADEQEPSLSATYANFRPSSDDSMSMSGMSTGLDACSLGDEDSAIKEDALGVLDLDHDGAAPEQVIKVTQPAAFFMQENGRPKLQLKKRDPALRSVGAPPMVANPHMAESLAPTEPTTLAPFASAVASGPARIKVDPATGRPSLMLNKKTTAPLVGAATPALPQLARPGLETCSSGNEDSAIKEDALAVLDLDHHGAAPPQAIQVTQPAAFFMQENGRPKLQLKKRDPSLRTVGAPPMVANSHMAESFAPTEPPTLAPFASAVASGPARVKVDPATGRPSLMLKKKTKAPLVGAATPVLQQHAPPHTVFVPMLCVVDLSSVNYYSHFTRVGAECQLFQE